MSRGKGPTGVGSGAGTGGIGSAGSSAGAVPRATVAPAPVAGARWTSLAVAILLVPLVPACGDAGGAAAGDGEASRAGSDVTAGVSGPAAQEPAPALASSEPLPHRLGIGRPATDGEIAAWDIDVRPDGTGLPPGSGTAADGAVVYARLCASCHGAEGEGGVSNPLVSDDPEAGFARRVTGHFWPYATTLYDYMNRSMPFDAPGTLAPDEVYGLVAWLLARNGVIADDAVMDAVSLPAVEMPGRDRFVVDDRRGGAEVR